MVIQTQDTRTGLIQRTRDLDPRCAFAQPRLQARKTRHGPSTLLAQTKTYSQKLWQSNSHTGKNVASKH